MENNGYIKLYRKIFDNPILNSNNDYRIVWENLLLLATHEKMDKIFAGQRITLKPGQLITGRRFLAQISNVHPSKAERVLKVLEIEQQIEQQKTNKNRLITILNWERYQTTNNKTNNQRTTSEQPANTYKNDKNEKKRGTGRFAPPSLEEVTNFCKERKNTVNPQNFIDFYTSKGWLVGKTKMKDWRAAVRTWESREPNSKHSFFKT